MTRSQSSRPLAAGRMNKAQRERRVQALLAEFDVELEARCKALHSFSEDAVLSLRNTLHAQIMRIPRKLRALPMSEFLGADETAVALRGMQQCVREDGRAPAAEQRTSNDGDVQAETQLCGSSEQTALTGNADFRSRVRALRERNTGVTKQGAHGETDAAKAPGDKSETAVAGAAQSVLMQLMAGELTDLSQALEQYDVELRAAIQDKVNALKRALSAL
ncbi:hypothetical protein CDCA_CDCA08G2430 [Cyanidium caldarium]|uniref:Borealin N-terminal domain-containing protein n=1 Tax=Cyanidium caldarium TaxID=2771 RepID=A0AAV9IVR3_CYACA|nr:hypothetical protein CDCA_CDCA08G2430 [Cyanidium caldarium]|eukprot:ctg_3647.g431